MELNENELCKCGHIGSMHWQYFEGCGAGKCKCKNKEKIILRDRLNGLRYIWLLVIPAFIVVVAGWLVSFILPISGLPIGTAIFIILVFYIIGATGMF